jgi:catechol 2,3-dioxygenase-like lactoylglutathione lyase family enzyme
VALLVSDQDKALDFYTNGIVCVPEIRFG